jgi:hypothetical protein
VDPAAPARRAAFRHARRKGTTRSNQKQELPTTGQTPKAHGIGAWRADNGGVGMALVPFGRTLHPLVWAVRPKLN